MTPATKFDLEAIRRELRESGLDENGHPLPVVNGAPVPDPFKAAKEKILEEWKARRFDPAKQPPEMRTLFELGGVTICTPGNLTAITAQAKTGKSSLVAAMIAAAMTKDYDDVDTLSARGFNEAGKALLYVDTEQSPDDFWHLVDRAKRRARLTDVPAWLEAATLAGKSCQDAKQMLAVALEHFAEVHGGVHAVIIDGIADLVVDVNDSAECNQIVAELHTLAIRYDCAIICVIHKNPGTDKVRGHLGSQIERKAETNLSLDKEDEVTIVWSQKQRRSPILKKTGPRFKWSDDMKMHVTVATVASEDRKTAELRDLAESILPRGQKLDYKTLREAIVEARSTATDKITTRTAERTIEKMRNVGLIKQEWGAYFLVQSDLANRPK